MGTPRTPRSPRAFLRSLIGEWGHAIQALGAIAGVVVAVMAIVIQQDIAKQEAQRQRDIAKQQEQKEADDTRRAAIERSIALYDNFMNSEYIRELIRFHVEIHKNYAIKGQKTRDSFSEAVIESTRSDEQIIYRNLALLLNDIEPIAKCSKYERGYWKDGKVEFDVNESDIPPLCDRESFRTLLFGPLSELFFSYRYFLYCDQNLEKPYRNTIKKFEIMIADYVVHDHKPDSPGDEYFVFLDDRDKERAIDDKLIERSEYFKFPTLRLPYDGTPCRTFRRGFTTNPHGTMP